MTHPASGAGQHRRIFTYDQLSTMVYRCDEIGKRSSSSRRSRLIARARAERDHACMYWDFVLNPSFFTKGQTEAAQQHHVHRL